MSRTLANVTTGVVTGFITVDSHMDALAYRRGWFDVTDINPAPQLGWHWDGTQLLPAPPPPDLSVMRLDRVSQLRAACQSAIVTGFNSAALGSVHTYPSTETDQRNLSDVATAAGAATAGWTTPLWCEVAGAWALTPHTATQVQQVMADWIAYRVAQQQRLVTLLGQITSASDPITLAAVTWPAG